MGAALVIIRRLKKDREVASDKPRNAVTNQHTSTPDATTPELTQSFESVVWSNLYNDSHHFLGIRQCRYGN